MSLKQYFIFFVWCLLVFNGYSQGILSGSFESNNVKYFNDLKTGAIVPDAGYGSNNYMKVDYSSGNLSFGLQFESYMPSMVGFSNQLQGSKITNRYAKYSAEILEVVAGNYYEQFGSGLIFRTYEERALGINNSLDGVNIHIKPAYFISIKGVWGKQRKFMELGNGIVRGGDLNLSLGEFITDKPLLFDLGASWINRFEDYTGPEDDFPESVDAYSFRGQLDVTDFSFYSEYVMKGEDPTLASAFQRVEGNAFLFNAGYSVKGFGLNASFRRLENMNFRSERMAIGEASMINYLPALTRQHSYGLALLYPYVTNVDGEIGGQADVFYAFKKGSILGGKYGTKLHLNYSEYYSLNQEQWLAIGDDKLYHDLSLDVNKKWNRKLKTIFTIIHQYYNKGKIEGGDAEAIKSIIAVGDVQYKINSKFSFRSELQYLWTKQDDQNWMMGLVELNYSPMLTLFASNMYNVGNTKIYYYNVGGSYSHKSSRFSMSYARNKEGLQCVGGVCRYLPAFTGLSLSMTSRF